MRILDTTRRAVVKLAKAVAGPPPLSGFICGECERWRSCGLPPSKNCPVMLEQITREDRDAYHMRAVCLTIRLCIDRSA